MNPIANDIINIFPRMSHGGTWRISRPLTISGSKVHITDDLIVTGSLTILGPTISASVQQLYIKDPIIVVNDNSGSAWQTTGYAGIEVRLSGSFLNDALIVFDIDDKKWQMDVGGTSSLENIATENYVTASILPISSSLYDVSASFYLASSSLYIVSSSLYTFSGSVADYINVSQSFAIINANSGSIALRNVTNIFSTNQEITGSLNVSGGVDIGLGGDGLVLTAVTGERWKLTIDATGSLITTSL